MTSIYNFSIFHLIFQEEVVSEDNRHRREEDPAEDLFFMQKALDLAKKAYKAGEVPVGAVLVLEGQVIAEFHNRVEELQDVQGHAEMLVLKEASLKLGNWRLLNSTLYCTLEPCPMCASALLLARVKRLVYAAPDKRLGAAGSFVDLFSLKHPYHHLVPEKGPLSLEAADLMRSFFQERRSCKGKENTE